MSPNTFQDPIPIKLTARAIEEIKFILKEKNIPAEYGLRVGTQGGGCSGVSYVLGFDKKKDTDKVYDFDNVTVFIDKRQVMFLFGVEVDFEEGVDERGFVFNAGN